MDPPPRRGTRRDFSAFSERGLHYFLEHHQNIAEQIRHATTTIDHDPEPARWPDDSGDTRLRIRALLRRYHLEERERRRRARKSAPQIKEYTAAHPEKKRHGSTQWYMMYPERARASKRAYIETHREEINAYYRRRSDEAARLRARQCQEEDPGIEERWNRICRKEILKGAPQVTPRACERIKARQTAELTRRTLLEYDDRDPVDLLVTEYVCSLHGYRVAADRGDAL